MISGSHGNKGGTTDEAFQEQCFLWERRVPIGAGFGLFKTFNIWKNPDNTTLKEKGKKK